MAQTRLFPDGVPTTIVVVLGAGASRAVSYGDDGEILSPLDADFFDLLQRVDAGAKNKDAVSSILSQVQKLPYGCWRSMERSFYTLHMRAYLQSKLDSEYEEYHFDEDLIKHFAQCVQVLLRKAHGTQMCLHHEKLLNPLHEPDTILSFNYDLVPERALKPMAEQRGISLQRWIYGLAPNTRGADLPLVLKLHGSSNWKLNQSDNKTESIEVRTKTWSELDEYPGYRGDIGEGTAFPIFLPFWDKRIERQPWLHLWRKAYDRLRAAEALVVWGYSLPATDIKAQHFFTLALANKVVKLCVIDPAEETRRRWRELLPQAHYFPYQSIEHFFQAPPKWWRMRTGPAEGN
jgi:hypothetical protein